MKFNQIIFLSIVFMLGFSSISDAYSLELILHEKDEFLETDHSVVKIYSVPTNTKTITSLQQKISLSESFEMSSDPQKDYSSTNIVIKPKLSKTISITESLVLDTGDTKNNLVLVKLQHHADKKAQLERILYNERPRNNKATSISYVDGLISEQLQSNVDQYSDPGKLLSQLTQEIDHKNLEHQILMYHANVQEILSTDQSLNIFQMKSIHLTKSEKILS